MTQIDLDGSVTIVFLGIVVAGLLMVLSTLTVSHVLGKDDREGPPFRLLAQGTGVIGVGVGGSPPGSGSATSVWR
jgi:hypothetical protein